MVAEFQNRMKEADQKVHGGATPTGLYE
jgi:hypothetical protein